MYNKVFASIYTGSLRGQFEALVVMQKMITVADANGYIDMTRKALNENDSMTEEFLQVGLDVLMNPDPESRRPDCEGRRLLPLYDDGRKWGWRLVNHNHYHNLRSQEMRRDQDRERAARYRENKKCETEATPQPAPSPAPSPNPVTSPTPSPKPKTAPRYSESFLRFWDAYPARNGRKPGKHLAYKEWSKIHEDERESVIAAAVQYTEEEFPKDACRFLKDEFWRDWLEPKAAGNYGVVADLSDPNFVYNPGGGSSV